MSFSSKIQQSPNYKVEKKVNKLVHVLLQAQHDYTAIVAHLRKDDVAQDGVRKYFKRRIEDTQSEIQTLIKIQQQIGGTVILPELRAPTNIEFESVLEILHDALVKDKKINKILLEIHSRVLRTVEQPLSDAILDIEEMLQERDQHIQQIVEQILHLEQNQGQVGEYVVSKLLKEEHIRVRKIQVEELQMKYKSTKEQAPFITRRRILTARRPSEKRRQLHEQLQSPKLFLNQQRISKSDFDRQFKSKKSLERSSPIISRPE